MSLDPVNNLNVPGIDRAGKPKKTLGQEDFLKLMVTQAKNLDPLDPQTNGDFMAQMAQFSTNDSINRMQSSMENLAMSLQSNQALQASALVGRKVLVNYDHMTLESEGGAKVAVDLPAPVSELTAFVYGTDGSLINKVPLGQHPVGQFDFNWNGFNQSGERMPAGKYRVEVTGRFEGQEVALRTMTTANVDSVSLNSNGYDVQLNVDGLGVVSLADVRQISA